MKMKMALGSLSGAFEGTVRMPEQTPPNSFRLVVEGTGRIGFVKGDGLLKLTPADGGGTQVAYEGEAQAGRTITAVGLRLIDGSAKTIVPTFFTNNAATAPT